MLQSSLSIIFNIFFILFEAWDILAYKALNIDPMMIYNVDESSNLVIEGSGVETTYRQIINNITNIFPPIN